VRKIILEILKLLWKALRLVLWKWLRPLLGKIVFFTIIAIGLVVLLISILR
jgi:hypothetical protein